MDPDDDLEDHVEPWTPAGAAALLAAGEALAQAVRTHAGVLAAVTQSPDIRAVFAANDVLLPVVLAYADAQLNHTGSGFPFDVLHDFEDGDDEDGDEGQLVGDGLSVLSRQDFVVTDEQAVLAAGRSAYQELRPEDPPSAAAEDVTHLGRALDQYAHLHGWDQVREMPGVVPTGATTVVHAHDDLLSGHPDGWPDDPFAVDAPVIWSQNDVYG